MKVRIIVLIIGVLLISKYWIGIYAHPEFGDKTIFVKHRAIWKTFFYSPIGESNIKLTDLSIEKQEEQLLFNEFIIANQTIE